MLAAASEDEDEDEDDGDALTEAPPPREVGVGEMGSIAIKLPMPPGFMQTLSAPPLRLSMLLVSPV